MTTIYGIELCYSGCLLHIYSVLKFITLPLLSFRLSYIYTHTGDIPLSQGNTLHSTEGMGTPISNQVQHTNKHLKVEIQGYFTDVQC